MNGTRWWSVHVVYYAEDRHALLLDAVEPWWERIRPHVTAAYWIPHWRRGPHLRLDVETDATTFADVVTPAVDEIVRPFLAEHPSRAAVDPGRLLAAHRRLADLEREDGPLTPLRPDNSVHLGVHDRRLAVLGSDAAADLLAEFRSASTRTAFDAVRATPRRAQLVALAYDLTVATAHALSGVGLARGFVSFRSHADAFLSWWPEADGFRAAWDRHYRSHAARLLARTAAVTEAIDHAPGTMPLVGDWVDLLGPFWDRGGELLDAGQLSLDPPWAGVDLGDPAILDLLRRSPFHGSRLTTRRPVNAAWFARYRLMLNYTYLHLTRLGLTPVERFLLCHLAAGAAEELYGVVAPDVAFPAPEETAAPAGRRPP